MKKSPVIKIIKETLSVTLLPAMLVLVVIVFLNRDVFVTYDANYSQENNPSSCVNVSTDVEKNEYLPLSFFPEDVYSIACEGELICVYNSNNEKVYTAKALLSEFPESDKLVLMEKITSLNLDELLEIMEYIES